MKSPRRPPLFEPAVLILALCAAALLLPLGDWTRGHPGVAFGATMVLFWVPGTLLAWWSVRGRFPGVSLLAVGFALSVGIFGVLGVPMLVLQRSIDDYLMACGAVVLASLLLAAARTLVVRLAPDQPAEDRPEDRSWRALVLWPPFLALCGTLAYLAGRRRPGVYDDMWVYLSWVRDFAYSERLATRDPYFGELVEATSRARINGWLLEQAAMVRVSGIDPVTLVVAYLKPTLAVVSLLLVYALGRALFRSAPAALLAGCLYALFLLTTLAYTPYNSGMEFVARVAEDKFTSRYLFLPAALAFSLAYLEGGGRRYLYVFTLVCWASVAVHPAGFAIIGLSMLGFGLLQVAAEPRSRTGWARMVALAAGVLSVVIVPGAYLLATGRSPVALLSSADINGNTPEVLQNMAFVRPGWKHVFEFGDGLYAMHPDFLMNASLIGAFLVGVPFLMARLRQTPAARLLLGALLLPTLVCFVPPVATFVGDHVVVPGQLWRLAWPIPLAALLALGWTVWGAVRRATDPSRRWTLPPALAPFLCAAVLAAVAFGSWHWMGLGVGTALASGSVPENKHYPYDPMLGWIGANLDGPAVVLAQDMENTWIPAYAEEVTVVSLRAYALLNNERALEERVGGPIRIPQRYRDVRAFFSGTASAAESFGILRRNDVDYLMLHRENPMNRRIEGYTGFTKLTTPGDRYNLYAVDLEALGARGNTP